MSVAWKAPRPVKSFPRSLARRVATGRPVPCACGLVARSLKRDSLDGNTVPGNTDAAHDRYSRLSHHAGRADRLRTELASRFDRHAARLGHGQRARPGRYRQRTPRLGGDIAHRVPAVAA